MAEEVTLSFRIAQDKLQEALGLVARAVARHPVQPVLSNICLRAQAEQLTFYATDLDLSISVQMDAEIIREGQITLPAQKITEIVNKLPRQAVQLNVNETQGVTITAGRSRFELNGLAADEFPFHHFQLPAEEEQLSQLNFPMAHLRRGFELVGFASDKKELSSILNGICVELSEQGLEIAATDGSRLAYYRVARQSPATEARKCVIPFRTVNELLRFWAGEETDQELQFMFTKNASFRLALPGRTIASNLVEGNYPKYQQLIPQEHSKRARLKRTDFIECLERVAVLANEKNKIIKLLFEEIGVLSISANTPDLGGAQDQLDLQEYQGEDFTIAFNVNYMLECLKNLSFCEEIELKMSEPLKPVIVTPLLPESSDGEEDPSLREFDYLYLLMPVQVRN